ncbi:phage tail assembly chaperone [Methylocystis sp. S23]
MSLADSEIHIRFYDGEAVICRPTLRAAMRLERQYNGFENLLKAIAEENISAMATVIRETSDHFELVDFLDRHNELPLNVCDSILVPQLLKLVLMLAGVDEDQLQKQDETEAGEKVPFAEHHERLFKIATGYLGWTPLEAWNATPSEIKAAYEGRFELLKAIFGGEENKTPAQSEAALAAFLRSRVRAV